MYAFGDYLTKEQIKRIKHRMIYVECCVKCYGMSFEKQLIEGIKFWSYETEIAMWESLPYGDGKLHVNYYAFDCSNSTIRQFSYWLRAHGLPAYRKIKMWSQTEAINRTLDNYDYDVNKGGWFCEFYDDETGITVVFDL